MAHWGLSDQKKNPFFDLVKTVMKCRLP